MSAGNMDGSVSGILPVPGLAGASLSEKADLINPVIDRDSVTFAQLNRGSSEFDPGSFPGNRHFSTAAVFDIKNGTNYNR
jgi:hypothetical protein